MKIRSISIVLFLTLGISLRLQAYEISIQKYSTENKKNYCFELYERLFNKPYNYIPSNRFIPTAQFLCIEGKEGKALLDGLHQVEFANRFAYKSHELTISMLNKANILLEGHKNFIRNAKKMQLECQRNTSVDCLMGPYMLRREFELLLNDYESLLTEIFQLSMSCSKEDIGQIGCFEETINDPYLQLIKVKTILSPADTQILKRVYQQLKNAKGKVEIQFRRLSERGVRK